MAQWNKNTQDYLNQERSLFEVNMLATKDGNAVSVSNPFPVSLGSSNITITGNVNVGTSVSVSNFPASQTVSGTVNIGTIPEVEVKNDSGNPLSVSGIVTVQDGGNVISVDDAGGSLTIDGLVSAAQTGSWTVEVNNDSGNPLPISKNTTVNSQVNPIWVESSNIQATSKGRLKSTTYSTGFFNTFQHGKALDVWDESLTSGGTSTWDNYRSSVNISVTSTVGSKVVRQTRSVMRYVPGRPAEYSQAVIFNAHISGVRQRVGMFDDEDGFYFERSANGTLNCVIRSNTTGTPLETRVPQSSWNEDKLNGTGASGLTLDLSKSQLVVVDYEWYGVGAVTFSFVIDNETIKAHTFYHANTITDAWCSTPFLPMRIEMENVSATSGASMFQISTCHSQEAMSDSLGFPLSIATPITGKSLTSANTYYPVLSVRLKSVNLNGVFIPQYLQAGTTDNTFINYQLLLNATLTGASWTNHPVSESIIQYDTTASAVTGGTILNQGFAAAGYNDRLSLNENAASGNFQLGRSSMGTVSDTLTIAIAAGNANKAGIAVLNWIEQR